MSKGRDAASLDGLAGLGRSRIRHLWILGLILYMVAVWYIGWQNLRDAVADINLPLLCALMAVEAVALWLRVLKWRMVLGAGNDATGLAFISKAGGNLSPARVGEFSPLLLSKHRSSRLGAWILMDRLMEMSVTLALGLLGLLAVGVPGQRVLLLWVLGALATIALMAYGLTRRSWFLWGAGRFPEASFPYRAFNTMAAVSEEMVLLGPKAPILSLMTLVAKCLDLVVGILLYASLGYWIPFAVLAMGQCIHALTSLIPITPNATGIPYAATATFLHQVVGVPLETLAVAIPVRIAAVSLIFWSSFAVGISSMRKGRPRFRDIAGG